MAKGENIFKRKDGRWEVHEPFARAWTPGNKNGSWYFVRTTFYSYLWIWTT